MLESSHNIIVLGEEILNSEPVTCAESLAIGVVIATCHYYVLLCEVPCRVKRGKLHQHVPH